MKKLLSILFILVIACSMAFAVTHTIKAGTGFNYGYGTVAKAYDWQKYRYIKNCGIDLDLGYDLEFKNGVVIYDNFGFGILTDIQRKSVSYETTDPWYTGKVWVKEADCTKTIIMEDIGAGYAFHFTKFRLLCGGGLHYECIYSSSNTTDRTGTFGSLGANLLVECSYQFSRHFSALGGLKQNLNFLSFWDYDSNNSIDTDGCTGGAFKYGGSAYIGAAFKF